MKLRITWESIKDFKPEITAETSDREKIQANIMVFLRHWTEKIDAIDLPGEKKALIIYGDILDKQIDILKVRHNINRILQGNENLPDKIELEYLTGVEIEWTKNNLWNILFFDKIALYLMRAAYNELSGKKPPVKKEKGKVKQSKKGSAEMTTTDKPKKVPAEKAEKVEKSEKAAKKAKADKKADAAAQKILERVEAED